MRSRGHSHLYLLGEKGNQFSHCLVSLDEGLHGFLKGRQPGGGFASGDRGAKQLEVEQSGKGPEQEELQDDTVICGAQDYFDTAAIFSTTQVAKKASKLQNRPNISSLPDCPLDQQLLFCLWNGVLRRDGLFQGSWRLRDDDGDKSHGAGRPDYHEVQDGRQEDLGRGLDQQTCLVPYLFHPLPYSGFWKIWNRVFGELANYSDFMVGHHRLALY